MHRTSLGETPAFPEGRPRASTDGPPVAFKLTRQKTIAEMIEEKMATEIKKQALSIKRYGSALTRGGVSMAGFVRWLATRDM